MLESQYAPRASLVKQITLTFNKDVLNASFSHSICKSSAKALSEQASLSAHLIALPPCLKPFGGPALPMGWSPHSQQHREGPSGVAPADPPAPFLTTPFPLHLIYMLAVPGYALLCMSLALSPAWLSTVPLTATPLPATHWLAPVIQDAMQVSLLS